MKNTFTRRDFIKYCTIGTAGIAASLALAGCKKADDSTSATANTPDAGTKTDVTAPTPVVGDEPAEYRVLYASEVSSLNYLITSNANEMTVGANVIDTLLEYDSFGELKASLATDWKYDEASLTWTFTLREGEKWVDTTGNEVADVTAQDFVDAMQYVLTPEYGSSTAQNLFGVIKNAEEYYNGLAGEEGYDEIDFAEVGIKALDKVTLQYSLAKPIPYFLSMLTYVCFMPAYGSQLFELGTSFGTSADTMYYNGAFYLSCFEPQVQMIYSKNTHNWDADNVFIDTIKKTYNAEAGTIGAEMAKRGEIDYTTLSADVVDAWLADPATAKMVCMERPAIDYNYFYCFNFNVKALNEDYYRDGMTGYSMDEKYEPENWEKAVNNEAFRQSLKSAINRISTMSVAVGSSADPTTYIQNTITPVGFSVDSETGLDYTAQPALKDIMANDSYNKDKALEYKAQAMKELEGKVTFPVKILVRYNPATTNWEDESIVLEQQLESVLGADYIDVIVEAGPSDGFLNTVRRSCDYMLLKCNWGADYADPETWTDPFYQAVSSDHEGGYNRGMRYAYLAYAISDKTESADTVKKYFELVEAAKEITDNTDERYAAFAEAEAYLINHAFVVPYGTSVSDFVVTKLDPWEGQYAAFGVSNLRYKGQHLMSDFVSMEQYEASAAQH